MKRGLIIVALVAMLGCGALAAPASASFGFKRIDVTSTAQDGSPAMEAGSHPYAFTNVFEVETTLNEAAEELPDGAFKDLEVDLPPGFVATPGAVPTCSNADFLASTHSTSSLCPDASAVGTTKVEAAHGPRCIGCQGNVEENAVYNLNPPPGVVVKFGFVVLGVAVTVEAGLRDTPPYNAYAKATNISQAVAFFGSTFTLWGVPADPVHDTERGNCLGAGGRACPASIPVSAYITLPRSCTGPLATLFQVRSWQNPGTWVKAPPVLTHDNSLPPNPLGLFGCAKLGFAPHLTSQPTTDQASSPSGLDVNLDVNDEGLANPTGHAQSDVKKAVVALPEGVTANPSLAEGLATCSPGQYEKETVDSEPGDGCPQESKIGTVEVETPLLEGKIVKGSVFIATQDDPTTSAKGAENPFDSLLALYMVIREPQLGVLVKLPGKVEPDPATGQLVTTFGEAPYEIPQLPFSHFRFHFREGGRSPLLTPDQCGTYTTEATFTPWANPSSPLQTSASFQINRGVGGGPCPPAGTPPFAPGFSAGSINNDAGHYSPFFMRLLRRDGDQDLTKFSAKLPPGLTAKLAGVGKCSDASIAAAKTRRGRAELAAPSCPANSKIGDIQAGAGAGSEPTYVPGKVYLAGPYNGAPLSVVAIVPAVAGPFDVGTVVTRFALQVDSRTAEVEVDGSHSDPIPHILAGIPLKVRDVRATVDRPEFALNPTSCDPFAVGAKIWGGGADLFSALDDSPVSRSVRYQIANCARLGFKPRLSLRLKGGTRRGGHPALRAEVTPRPGDANFAQAVVTLPRSAFLDQGHIRTICTRVQFAAHACPSGAIYGFAKAITPILDEPAEGPVYLRSSNHNLPDLVFALKGPPSVPVDVEISGRIDSHKGGIRASFESIPDLPVTKFILNMQGGKKGLIVNSRNLCTHTFRANADLIAQNGNRSEIDPVVKAAGCGGKTASKPSRSNSR